MDHGSAMNRVSFILLLVSVLGSRETLLSNAAFVLNKSDEVTRNDVEQPRTNITAPGESNIGKDSFVETSTVHQPDDQDPSESSETVVYNRFEKPASSEGKSPASDEEEEDPEGPPDHEIPYSEHEETRNVPTRPKYTAPGEWAKPARGDQRVANQDFVPSKVYAQVRKTHTLRRLPRRKAIEHAESDEEKENAARLREVVKNTKVNTVYTEEGYEDSAYDHAGHIRDADFREGYARKLRDHLDLRKKSENDKDAADYDDEKNETRQRNYKKVRPDEFRDFDDDYRDVYDEANAERSSVTENVRGDEKWKERVDPKEIAEDGIEKLQEDLENEAAEIEKGTVEIGKLETVETTTAALVESRRSDDYDRMKDLRWRRARGRTRASPSARINRPREDSERLGVEYNLENSTTDTLDRARESVTFDSGADKDAPRPQKYEIDGDSSPNFAAAGVESDEDSPTTISYSQLLWEYFKKQAGQMTTTEAPRILEPTTLNSNMVPGSLLVNANGIAAYPVYVQEATTSYPILESAVLTPEPSLPLVPIGPALLQPEYSKDHVQSGLPMPLGTLNANQAWRPMGTNGLSATETVPHVEIYPNGQNFVSDEESGKNFNEQPLLNSLAQRKPRYKITIRPKPSKPSEYPSSPSPQPVTSSPLVEPMTENPIPGPVTVNENYLKMLMHLQSEKNAKSHYQPNGVRQSNGFPLSSSKNELEDLTRLRPPLPQKLSHYYYDLAPPRGHPEIDAAALDWRGFPAHQRQPQLAHPVPRKASMQPSDSRQRQAKPPPRKPPRHHPSSRKRNVPMPFDPLLASESVRQMDGADHANRYRSKRARNVHRPFRQPYAVDGARGARMRERRSAGRSAAIGGERSIANNGTSNRGEIERPAKPAAERNCRQKVTRGDEVGPVPDTSPAKQPAEKKSRSCGEGPRAAERESSAVAVRDGNEGKLGNIGGDSGSLGYDEESVGNFESTATSEDRAGEIDGGKDRGIVSNLGMILGEGIKLEKGNATNGVVESVMESELEELEKWLNLEESKMNGGENASELAEAVEKNEETDKVELNGQEFRKNGKFYGLGELKSDGVEDGVELKRAKRNTGEIDSDRLKQHDRLLNEAPRIAEDVIQKEIDARFNEKEEKDKGEEDREKEVEVEVPEFDYVEEIIEDEEDRVEENISTTEQSLDLLKYPFYDNEKLPMASALKYATAPEKLPRKSRGGMEFYNSRDAYKHCDEVEPNLEVAPENEEPVAERDPNENPPRLQGLGDKLDCFKAKYFDNNPFDNPLFLEKEVQHPAVPPQFDTMGFASRIMVLPKENDDFVIQRSSKRPENYRQPRKPITVRLQKTRRIRYKNYPRTRNGSRTRPRKRPPVYRLQVPQMKNSNTTKKSQNSAKSPIASASELSSFYMPYQNQVYEDVMGTIKNMASLYQVQEITTTVSPEETTVVSDIDDDVKMNSTTNSTNYGIRDKGKVQIDIMDRPSDVDINIKAPVRPKNRNRYRTVYKRTRRPLRNKPRIHLLQTPVVAVRAVKHRPRVRVYKRDLSDVSRHGGRRAQSSEEVDSTETDEGVAGNLSNVKKFQNHPIRNNPTAKSSKEVSLGKNSTIKRKTKVLKSVRRIDTANSGDDQKKDPSAKVVYTIKDRIKYSKPKNEVRRVGKFVSEPKAEVDERRREPKYNSIPKKNSANSLSSTVDGSSSSSTGTTNSSEIAAATEKLIESKEPGLKDENKEALYAAEETRNEDVAATIISGDSKQIAQANEQTPNKTEHGYAVYENVNEGDTVTTTTTTTTTPRPQSATPSEFFNLQSFLEIDPPGYMELSSEDFKRSFFSNDNSTGNDNITTNLDPSPTNTTENRTEKDAGSLTNYGPPYFSDEDEESSSERAETRTKIESSTESSEESSAPSSKENDSEEDRTFFSYTPRPSSPAEIYEDPKYSDLGPRVNKPAFFHPPFSKYRQSRSRDSVEEVAESDERKEEYVFPWHKDKEDQRRRRRGRPRGKSNGEYEYPWERRERLAREEKLRKEQRRKRLGFDDDDDDEQAEESYVSKQLKNPYPRGRYRYWSRKDRDAAEDNVSDNTENTSEYQPSMKYSSRYNSKSSKLPFAHKQPKARRGSVEEISKSIKKALEGDSEEKVASKEKEDGDGSWEKKKSFSYRPRSVSRGIVPEDVTLAPTRKPGKRGKLKAGDSRNATVENGNSSEARSGLDDSESKTATAKSSTREARNSTDDSSAVKQPSKKRRKASKSAAAIVENTTKAEINETKSRSRRKQKLISTTPKRIASTTAASTVIRRRNQKSPKDAKRNEGAKPRDKSRNDVDDARGMSKSGTVEHRSRGRKKNRTSGTASEVAKNEEERDLATNSSRNREQSEKVNDEPEGSPRNETVGKKSIDDESSRDEEAADSKQTYPSVRSEERYDYKDQRTVTVNDFDSSDRTYDDEGEDYDDSGSVIETEANFAPPNGAVQLSEQGSRELATSVSWISENYDF